MVGRWRKALFAAAIVGVVSVVPALQGEMKPKEAAASEICNPTVSNFTASGTGDITSSNYGSAGVEYAQVKFTSTTECSWTIPSGVTSADIVLVGGGGAGGYGSRGGGGGAGEVAYKTGYGLTPEDTVTVLVGAGGESSGDTERAENGSQTLFGSVVALGGGRGGGDAGPAGQGGSSGGRKGFSSAASALGAVTSANSGFTHLASSGGSTNGNSWGAGGGGAGGAAAAATVYNVDSDQPDGGDSVTLFGAELAGGGGGWMGGSFASSGGGSVGGGWASGCTGTLPVANTGSGGGSCESGADGVIILRFAKLDQSISWSPNTSLELADSGVNLTASLTVGDGTLGYTVVNQGTTGCQISGSTLTFSSTGSGANGCEVRPTSTSTDFYNAKTDAPTVTFDISRGTFAISAPSSKVGTSSSSFTSVCTSSCDVSGFAAADQIRVVVTDSDGAALSGRVRLTSTTGLTQSLDGYQDDATSASGFTELGFEGTQSEVNAALETLQYESPSGGGDETIGISASLAGAAYFAGTGHYYEVISGDDKNHADAITAAASRTFNGLNGYLATILTEEENRFIDSKISERGVWIGGKYNGTVWQWITGPEEEQIDFWTGTNKGTSIPGAYAEWEPPNQPDGSDDCLSTNYDSPADLDTEGNWDDLTCTATKGWVVEYGGNGGTVLKEASTTFDVGAPTAPLQVSGLSATAGNGQLTLSWSAPGTGGSAITDYVVEQFDPDTSTWSVLTDGVSTSTSYVVTGLTNGTSYSFRVSAKNAIGTGSVSSTASGTPAVPAATSTSRNDDDDDEPVVVAPVVTPRVVGPPVRLPVPAVTPPAPQVLTGPVSTPSAVSSPVNRVLSRVGGIPAPVTATSSGDDEVSVSTSSMRLSLRMSEPGTVSTASDDVTPELTLKPGVRAAVTGSGLLPNTSVQVWLPNVSDRELGRLTVTADGELTGEVSLSSPLGEDPLPIGRQSLQVTGYDADGNQTVVEMPVNIAQGPPTPELNREVGALPDLAAGQSLATSAGIPTTVAVTPFAEQRIVAVDGGDWSLSVALNDQNGEVGGTSAEPLIRMTQSGQGSVTGDGFQPGTVASLWMFSDPTLLGTVTVAEDGSFNVEFLVDAQFLPVGEHTLQIQGVGTDGFIKAANLGVLIDAPPATTTADSALSIIWWLLAALTLAVVGTLVVIAQRRRQS